LKEKERVVVDFTRWVVCGNFQVFSNEMKQLTSKLLTTANTNNMMTEYYV